MVHKELKDHLKNNRILAEVILIFFFFFLQQYTVKWAGQVLFVFLYESNLQNIPIQFCHNVCTWLQVFESIFWNKFTLNLKILLSQNQKLTEKLLKFDLADNLDSEYFNWSTYAI